MTVLASPNDTAPQCSLWGLAGQVELEGGPGGSTLHDEAFIATTDEVGLAVAVAHLQLFPGECTPLAGHLGHVAEELDNTTKRHGLVST